MSGANDAPLLMLDRVGEGAFALLAPITHGSGDRGYEGAARNSRCCAALPTG